MRAVILGLAVVFSSASFATGINIAISQAREKVRTHLVYIGQQRLKACDPFRRIPINPGESTELPIAIDSVFLSSFFELSLDLDEVSTKHIRYFHRDLTPIIQLLLKEMSQLKLAKQLILLRRAIPQSLNQSS